MGGMVLETNMTEILSRIEEQNKLEKSEVRKSLSTTRTVGSRVKLFRPKKNCLFPVTLP